LPDKYFYKFNFMNAQNMDKVLNILEEIKLKQDVLFNSLRIKISKTIKD